MTISEKEKEDPLLHQIGDIGKWQVATFITLSLFCIPVAWQMMGTSFFMPGNVDHWCRRPAAFSNWTVEQWRQYSAPYTVDKAGKRQWDRCHIYALNYSEAPADPDLPPAIPTNKTINCPKLDRGSKPWEFDHSFYDWTANEHFDIVCEFGYLKGPITASYMAGVMIGVVVSGMISDRFGRRPTILAFLGAMLVMSLVVALSGSVMVFVVLRFLLALFIISEYTTVFVYCMEMVGGRWRIIMGLLFQLPFALGFMSMAGIAYAITNWQHLQLAISVPMVVFVVYYWSVPESPRWLLAAGKIERASALIESIADINGREFDTDVHLIPPNEERQHVHVHLLLRHPTVRFRTINIWFNWFANTFTYYGLLFAFAEVGDNLYLNTLIGGVVEIPAYLVSIGICLWLGRKWPIAIAMVLGGGCLLGTIGIERGAYTRDWPILVLTMVARYFITQSFGIVYVYAAEVFPTVLRNTGVSSSSMCGRVGSILAPLVASLVTTYIHLPAILYGSVSILAGLMILFMPETKQERMPDTLHDAEHLGKKHIPKKLSTNMPLSSSVKDSIPETIPEAAADNPAFEGDGDEDGSPEQGDAK